MSSTETYHASCLCGRVRLAACPPIQRIGHCHCDNCRRAQGAGVWTWITFKTEAVDVETGHEDLRQYRSDTDAIRQFCGNCGSSLTFASPRWPGVIDLSLANLEEPIDTAPDLHVYADRAPGWCPILDELPRLGGPEGNQPID
ncbi:MAG: GFA family protein [Acidobacteriota bacterium]|nr:GFA family protein [Acidobacteriota bacterium]MDH3784513.1 GFA family protein [Acidobacteriota bacterium]